MSESGDVGRGGEDRRGIARCYFRVRREPSHEVTRQTDAVVCRRRVAVALFLLVALVTSACGLFDDREDTISPSTTVDLGPPPPTIAQPRIAARPGTVLFAEPRTDAPSGGAGWRIGYWSTGADGDPVVVTGQVYVPPGTPPPGGWPVVAWAHPTVGSSDRCTPSIQGPTALHLVEELTAAGIAVAATDYEGLGTEGAHPYLVGPASGHDMLDSVRAASAIEGSGVSADARVVVAGFSQGGHAALWAAQVAPRYAPEIEVLGVFAAAPVTSVTAFAERAQKAGPHQIGVLVAIAAGMAQADPDLDLAAILTPEAGERLDILEDYCIGEAVSGFGRIDRESGVFAESPLAVRSWRKHLDANGAGQVPLGVPVRIVQGDQDLIVFEQITRTTAEMMCSHGDVVEYEVVSGANHALLTPERAVPWIQDRFAAKPAPDTCP